MLPPVTQIHPPSQSSKGRQVRADERRRNPFWVDDGKIGSLVNCVRMLRNIEWKLFGSYLLNFVRHLVRSHSWDSTAVEHKKTTAYLINTVKFTSILKCEVLSACSRHSGRVGLVLTNYFSFKGKTRTKLSNWSWMFLCSGSFTAF